MVLIIAVDTSHNKRYSCVVSGFRNDTDKLYEKITKILEKSGRKGIIHWRVISNKVRRRAKSEVYKIINDSPVQFCIFEHKKPENIEGKRFYLIHIPNFIASYLERWLRGKRGITEIKVDRDYEVKGIRNSSEQFVRNLLSQIGFRLIGTKVAVFKKKDFIMEIKQPDGSSILFIGSSSSRNLSKEIQLADLALGYYLYDKTGLDKIKFMKI